MLRRRLVALGLALLSSRQGTSAPRSVIREAAERQRNVIPRGETESIDQLLGGVVDTVGTGAVIDTTAASNE